MVNLDPDSEKSKPVYVGLESGDPIPAMTLIVIVMLSSACVILIVIGILCAAFG